MLELLLLNYNHFSALFEMDFILFIYEFQILSSTTQMSPTSVCVDIWLDWIGLIELLAHKMVFGICLNGFTPIARIKMGSNVNSKYEMFV